MTTQPDEAVLTAPATARKNRWIEQWNPEDRGLWDGGAARIARRNLIVSILTEHVGFSVWSLWSVFVLFLTPSYGISHDLKTAAAEKFLLTTLPTAVGAVLRLPYTLAVASTASPASCTTATPMFPPPAFKPSTRPFSRCG